MSSQGIASVDEVAFSFVILLLFYATTWFRMMAALALLTLVIGAHRLRVRELRRRQAGLERQVV